MKHIHVAAAVIIRDGMVFAAKRGNSGELAYRWEFPGGKLESKESAKEAIIREIAEELSTVISVDRHLMRVEHRYRSFSLTMDAFLCSIVSGTMAIAEHVECRWLSPSDLFNVDWADADIPIVHEVARLLAGDEIE